ncbi:MAG: hypothetical protein AB1716_12680 [Planctomycetota bacterium]
MREFENDPRVVVALMNQAESRATLEATWRNVYLRGQVIYDQEGSITRDAYAQPATGLPFGRGFLIGRDQRVVLPLFGYNPQRISANIHELLGEPSLAGDLNCDSRVDFEDISPFVLALGGYPEYHLRLPECNWYNADCNGDGAVSFGDINAFVGLLAGGPVGR